MLFPGRVHVRLQDQGLTHTVVQGLHLFLHQDLVLILVPVPHIAAQGLARGHGEGGIHQHTVDLVLNLLTSEIVLLFVVSIRQASTIQYIGVM